MATRGTTLDPEHIGALNSIPLDFERRKKKDEIVLAEWCLYMAHIATAQVGDDWPRERQRRLVNLLAVIGPYLGQKIDRAELEAGIYAPAYQGTLFDETEES